MRAAFQWRRKQLGKILRDHPDLRVPPAAVEAATERARAGLQDRPERLSPDQFITLSSELP